ncbi:hypothetical protein D3C80_1841480 [compost metagenome]
MVDLEHLQHGGLVDLAQVEDRVDRAGGEHQQHELEIATSFVAVALGKGGRSLDSGSIGSVLGHNGPLVFMGIAEL